jgi:TetR/AcrR family transcriptional regulator
MGHQARLSSGDRRQQIVDVATRLFARQGYEGTTTRQIAESAEVNEAIIFRHFSTKEDLYWAVIEDQCRMRAGREKLEQALGSGLDDEQIFTSIAREFLSRDATLPRLLLFSALERHEVSQRFFKVHVASYYEILGDYIRRRIEDGAFRDVDPILAARSFFGMLVYHFQIQELFGAKHLHDFELEHAVKTFVGIWLKGMRP